MKKVLIVLLCAFALGLECHAQYNGDKAVLVGTVRTDGYQTITKGAFWKQRPEAKQIYEGFTPSGYTVYVLEKPSFVRFIDKEHNNNDKNYIVFPSGSIVYTNNTTGKFYAAVCGNEIEYLGAIDKFVVQERGSVVFRPEQEEDWRKYKAPNKDNVITQPVAFTPPIEEKKKECKTWFGRNIVPVLLVGGATLVTGIVIATQNHDASPIEQRSMPGGIH